MSFSFPPVFRYAAELSVMFRYFHYLTGVYVPTYLTVTFGGSTSGGSVIKNTGTNTAAFSGGTPKAVNNTRFGALQDNTFKNTQTAGQAKQAPDRA